MNCCSSNQWTRRRAWETLNTCSWLSIACKINSSLSFLSTVIIYLRDNSTLQVWRISQALSFCRCFEPTNFVIFEASKKNRPNRPRRSWLSDSTSSWKHTAVANARANSHTTRVSAAESSWLKNVSAQTMRVYESQHTPWIRFVAEFTTQSGCQCENFRPFYHNFVTYLR